MSEYDYKVSMRKHWGPLVREVGTKTFDKFTGVLRFLARVPVSKYDSICVERVNRKKGKA